VAKVPHVLTATDSCYDCSEDEALSEDRAWLLEHAGSCLRLDGRVRDAVPLLERALRITDADSHSDRRDVADRLNSLALALSDLGQPAAARPLLERALRIIEVLCAPDDPAVATCLNNLGSVLRELGEPRAALSLLERASRIAERRNAND
jgi:tetratricopeptide (TPR) repeat protein